jgi:hypothetical protein
LVLDTGILTVFLATDYDYPIKFIDFVMPASHIGVGAPRKEVKQV